MQIPVCVVFPPYAIKGNTRGESIPSVLRDLFVTINQTAKEVSGHFLVLLDDKSLSALAVRELAERWKSEPIHDGLTKLHLLEWNQRLKSRSNQLEKKYSITTVSIIADTLERHIFDPKTGGLTNLFLNLNECKLGLEADGSWARVDSISNREFHPAQSKLLKDQVNRYLTPALDIIFSAPSPYVRRRSNLVDAKVWLDSQVVGLIRGADIFRDQCLRHFRKWTKLDHPSAGQIEADFESRCEHDEHDSPFFFNVFQQGMLRAWIDIAREAIHFGISPEITASAFVRALEKVCFSQTKNFFSSDQAYTRLSIYRDGGTVIVTESSKEQWKRLILCTLRNPEVWKQLEVDLGSSLSDEGRAALGEELKRLIDQCLFDFLEDLENAIQKDLEKNWKDREVTAQQQENLRKTISENGDKSEEFKVFVHESLTKPRVKKARQRLYAILELDSDE
jgi:hypothetical protein